MLPMIQLSLSGKQAKSTLKPLQWKALWGHQKVLPAALQNIVVKKSILAQLWHICKQAVVRKEHKYY